MGGESGVHIDGLWRRKRQGPSVIYTTGFTGFPSIDSTDSAYDERMNDDARATVNAEDELMRRVAEEFAAGRITRTQLQSLLEPKHTQRITTMSILMTIGLIVMYLGSVLVYSVSFSDYTNAVQLVTPFAFPIVVFVVLGLMIRRGVGYWQQEIIMTLALISTVVASVAAMAGVPGVHEIRWIQSASIGWIALGCLAWSLRRLLRSPMVLTCGGIIVLLMTTLERTDYAGHWYVPTLSLAASFLLVGIALWNVLHKGWG